MKNVIKVTSPVAIAILLSSCSGGTSIVDADSGEEPTAGAGNAVIDPVVEGAEQSSGVDSGRSLSGRVADGYIQGAIICIDLNESDSCEDDEPSAVSGEGGSYDLMIPAGAEDKPIVADIPAEAIDEDTGEAVGKSLVFIAPADRAEFISPITTLVHQELQSNPSLNIDDAENAVKTLLGISEEDVSLFENYVEGGEEEGGDADRKSNFRYLHDTARVVTSMMKDIETEVETAAVSTGLDVAGSDDTRRAIRDIVRREVKQLLPAIAQQVADIVSREESAGTDENGDLTSPVAFSPESIALALRPDSVTEDVRARIDAVVERVEAVQSDLQKVLSEGVYYMEFDCMSKEYDGEPIPVDMPIETDAPEKPAEPFDLKPDSEGFDDDAGEFHDSFLSNCSPMYSKTQLDDKSGEISSQNYAFDPESATWVEEMDEGGEYSDYALVNGEWLDIRSSDSGPEGTIEFASDGSAVLSMPEGSMQLRAVTQDLSASDVKKHLLSGVSDPVWFDLVQSTDMFASGAQAHLISVKETAHPYMLFNIQSDSDEGESSCAEYADNCNVIGTLSDNQFMALQSLTELREAAIKGTAVTSLHSGIGYGATMTFMINGESDGTLPATGSVKWSYGNDMYIEGPGGQGIEYPDSDIGLTYPAGEFDIESCYAPGIDMGEVDPQNPDENERPILQPQVGIPSSESDKIPDETGDDIDAPEQKPDDIGTLIDRGDDAGFDDVPEENAPFPDKDKCADLAAQSDQALDPANVLDKPEVEEPAMLSRWKMVEVDGVQMIEVQVPERFRFDTDNTEQATLLAVHNGFVRLGARVSDTYIDRVATYNETAFATLRAIVEKGVIGK